MNEHRNGYSCEDVEDALDDLRAELATAKEEVERLRAELSECHESCDRGTPCERADRAEAGVRELERERDAARAQVRQLREVLEKVSEVINADFLHAQAAWALCEPVAAAVAATEEKPHD